MIEVLATIMAGRTPRPKLMQSCGWWLIAACIIPTVVADLRALVKRSSAQEKEERDRLRRKLQHKLDRLISAARTRCDFLLPPCLFTGVAPSSSELAVLRRFSASEPGERTGSASVPTTVVEFYVSVRAYLMKLPGETGLERDSAKVDIRPAKVDIVEKAFEAVHKFEPRCSSRFVAGILIYAEACCHDMNFAIAETGNGNSDRYGDGQELEKVNKSAKDCLRIIKGAVGRISLRRVKMKDRAVLLSAAAGLRSQIREARPVLRQIYKGDRRKLLSLLWLGRDQARTPENHA
eukprot:SAG31_NODE_722_length_12572_cov_2.409124_2_plen_292_part_00